MNPARLKGALLLLGGAYTLVVVAIGLSSGDSVHKLLYASALVVGAVTVFFAFRNAPGKAQ